MESRAPTVAHHVFARGSNTPTGAANSPANSRAIASKVLALVLASISPTSESSTPIVSQTIDPAFYSDMRWRAIGVEASRGVVMLELPSGADSEVALVVARGVTGVQNVTLRFAEIPIVSSFPG